MVYGIGPFRESPSTGECRINAQKSGVGSCHLPYTNETDMPEVTMDMLVEVEKCCERFIARVASAGWK